MDIETTMDKKIEIKGDDLEQKHIYAYGIGHVLNDIVSACWFNFLSYYLIEVRCIDSGSAGIILLVAQITDAVSTPIVGILSDKTDTRWGKRTPWYIIGTIFNVVGYTMIWEKCFFCGEGAEKSDRLEFIYYLIFPPIMQMGWAAVQVAHMALLPCITLNDKNKDKMSRIRTGFTFISQLIALVLSVFFFWLISDRLLPYRLLSYSVQLVGLVSTLIFLYYCREVTLSKNIPKYHEEIKNIYFAERKRTEAIKTEYDYSLKGDKLSPTNSPSQTPIDKTEKNALKLKLEKKDDEVTVETESKQTETPMHDENENAELLNKPLEPIVVIKPQIKINWLYWMRRFDFWVYLVIYTFVRLSINITSTMIPFYMYLVLGYSTKDHKGTRFEIAVALVISTCGSVFNSIYFQKYLEGKLPGENRKIVMLIAFIMVSIGCLPIFFLTKEFRVLIFFLCFFLGWGFSLGLSSASYLINDVVGSKGSKGAFVYGVYSFCDKLSCGIVLAIFLPFAKSDNYHFLEWLMPTFPPLTMIFALLVIYFIKVKKDEPVIDPDEENIANFSISHITKDNKFTFITPIS